MISKFVFLTMMVSSAVIMATPAAAANVEWRGDVVVLTASSACSGYAGNFLRVRYRPSGMGSNGANSKLAFHESWFAHSYKISGRFANSYKTVDAGVLGAGWGSFADDGITAQVALTTPSSYNASTLVLAVSGGVKNFADTSGCNVTFRGSVSLMP